NRRAVSSPIPLVPPVIRARFPWSLGMGEDCIGVNWRHVRAETDFALGDASSRHQLLSPTILPAMDRRTFLQATAATAAALAIPQISAADDKNLEPIFTQITKQHDENVRRLQEWIHQPSIAAENREVNEGCELTMRLLRDAGFQSVTKVPS